MIQRFEVGVKAFVWHRQQLLLVRERNAAQGWELPGGRIDETELGLPLDLVLRRELREELGPRFDCRIGAICETWVRPPEPHRRLPVFLVGFVCSEPSGGITLSDEHTAHRWVGRDDWQTLPFAPGYAEPIARFFATR